MIEIVMTIAGLIVGSVVGFNYGIQRYDAAFQEVAIDFLEAVRARYGKMNTVMVQTGTAEDGTPVLEPVEVMDLDEDLENQADELFNIR